MNELAVDSIFTPLAFLGLLRLVAAFWLNDDYHFSVDTTNAEDPSAPLEDTKIRDVNEAADADRIRLLVVSRTLPSAPASRDSRPPSEIPKPINTWYSRFLRLIYIIPIFSLWAIPVLFIIP